MSVRPSQLLGLKSGSYEAFCFDQAAWYIGSKISGELDQANQAGQRKPKGQGKVELARKRVLQKYGISGTQQGSGYADPAAFFKQQSQDD